MNLDDFRFHQIMAKALPNAIKRPADGWPDKQAPSQYIINLENRYGFSLIYRSGLTWIDVTADGFYVSAGTWHDLNLDLIEENISDLLIKLHSKNWKHENLSSFVSIRDDFVQATLTRENRV